jgi:multicomponent Na+:H+ antiporter subunit B
MIGLGIALASGVYAVFFGDAFFTGQWWFIGDRDPGDYMPISSVLSSISACISWSSVRS